MFRDLFEKVTANLKMNPVLRKKVNAELYDIGKESQTHILDPVRSVLEANNLVMLQEDNTRWSGILAGREGRADIRVGALDMKRELPNGWFMFEPYTDCILVLTWYRLESGKYEVTAYLS